MPRLLAETGPHAGSSFEVADGSIAGRLASNAVPLPDDDEASRRHATFRFAKGRFFVKDLGSKNGTRVNGESVEEAPLKSGDRIGIGLTTFRYEDKDQSTRETAEALDVEDDDDDHGDGAPREREGRPRPAAEAAPSRRSGRGDASSGRSAGAAADPPADPTTRQALEVLLFCLLCVLVFLNASYAAQVLLQLVL